MFNREKPVYTMTLGKGRIDLWIVTGGKKPSINIVGKYAGEQTVMSQNYRLSPAQDNMRLTFKHLLNNMLDTMEGWLRTRHQRDTLDVAGFAAMTKEIQEVLDGRNT